MFGGIKEKSMVSEKTFAEANNFGYSFYIVFLLFSKQLKEFTFVSQVFIGTLYV